MTQLESEKISCAGAQSNRNISRDATSPILNEYAHTEFTADIVNSIWYFDIQANLCPALSQASYFAAIHSNSDLLEMVNAASAILP